MTQSGVQWWMRFRDTVRSPVVDEVPCMIVIGVGLQVLFCALTVSAE